MVAMTNFADMIKTAISEKVDIIIAGAGLPLDLPSFLNKGSKTKLVPIVSSARAAKIICEKWKTNYDYLPDAVIVEGPKAGGHLGFKEEQIFDKDFCLEKLVPEIVNELRPFEEKYNQLIPLIAAGGIYTGEDIHKILELGASGVQMGTRFVTTEE
jgi:NAD(P)H-dependent flavin oxidoreductase YrpB (nitropropane dioxygenase family)